MLSDSQNVIPPEQRGIGYMFQDYWIIMKGGLKIVKRPVSGYSDMTRVKRMAEVQTFREDLR